VSGRRCKVSGVGWRSCEVVSVMGILQQSTTLIACGQATSPMSTKEHYLVGNRQEGQRLPSVAGACGTHSTQGRADFYGHRSGWERGDDAVYLKKSPSRFGMSLTPRAVGKFCDVNPSRVVSETGIFRQLRFTHSSARREPKQFVAEPASSYQIRPDSSSQKARNPAVPCSMGMAVTW